MPHLYRIHQYKMHVKGWGKNELLTSISQEWKVGSTQFFHQSTLRIKLHKINTKNSIFPQFEKVHFLHSELHPFDPQYLREIVLDTKYLSFYD